MTQRLTLDETCGRASQSPRTRAGLRMAAEAIGIAPDGWSVLADRDEPERVQDTCHPYRESWC